MKSNNTMFTGQGWCVAVILGSFLLVLAGNMMAGAAEPTEYDIKAAYVYKFAKFCEWPDEAGRNSISIGVLGQGPIAASLEKTLKGKTLKDKPVILIKAQQVDSVKSCQIIYITSSTKEPLEDIMATLEGANVLTVSDIKDFSRNKGIVGFVWERDHVKFTVNLDNLRKTELSLSSKLLSIAKIVKN